MFKKSILPVFLLSLVVLLSIFYIKQVEDDTSVGGNDISDGGTTVLSDFATKRLAVLEERSQEVCRLETTIASGEVAQSEIAAVMNEINKIYYLKYTEVELEDAITILGYEECLVIISGYDVDVSVISSTITAKEFIVITNLIKTKLSSNYKVTVEAISSAN